MGKQNPFLIQAQFEFAAGIVGRSVWEYILLSAGFSNSEVKKVLRTIPSTEKLVNIPHGGDEIVLASISEINHAPITVGFYKEKFGISVACCDSQKEKEDSLQNINFPSGVFVVKKSGFPDSSGKSFFVQKQLTREIPLPALQIAAECTHNIITGNFINTRSYVRCFCPENELVGVGACENSFKKVRVFFEGSEEGISNRLASVGSARPIIV